MSRVAIKLTAMKNQLLFAALCAAFLVPARSDAEITVEAFYEPLDSYGDWIEVGDYGYCWQPHGTGSDWRPYTVGEWVYTDAGWTWIPMSPMGGRLTITVNGCDSRDRAGFGSPIRNGLRR